MVHCPGPFQHERTTTTEQERIQIYFEGVKEGIRMYAWWRDGIQYVGTTGLTLKEALVRIDLDLKNQINSVDLIVT